MDESERQQLISELKKFCRELKSYERMLDPNRSLSEPQKRYKESLRERLVRKSGAFKETIFEMTKKPPVIKGADIFWQEALGKHFDLSTQQSALPWCIDATTEAIGKLEARKEAVLRNEKGTGTAKEKQAKDTAKSPLQLFDAMGFHKKVVEASRKLYKDKHYAQAIFEAFKAIENFVQDKSGLTLYGTKLMKEVFNAENPIIKVPEGGYYYKDVQRGFYHLFVGATQAIRNPKAHKGIIQKDPYITLHYLGFASFMLKRIDYWEASIS